VIIYKEFHHGFIGKIEKPSFIRQRRLLRYCFITDKENRTKNAGIIWLIIRYRRVEGGTHSGIYSSILLVILSEARPRKQIDPAAVFRRVSRFYIDLLKNEAGMSKCDLLEWQA
jgi:hypothetical protein